MENQDKKLWFKRKTYGWGWTPATWQGWGVTFLYIAAIIHIAFYVDRYPYKLSNFLIGFVLPVAILTLILISICYKKGEKPKWQWGERKEK